MWHNIIGVKNAGYKNERKAEYSKPFVAKYKDPHKISLIPNRLSMVHKPNKQQF